MRKITQKVVGAFIARKPAKSKNTESTGDRLYLHGNLIAEHRPSPDDNRLIETWISNAGWHSVTTKDRLNAIPGVSISQNNFTWYLNGQKWSGEWTKVSQYNS